MKQKTATFVPLLFLAVYALLAFSQPLVGAVGDVSSNAFLSVSIVQFMVLLLPLAFYCGLNRRSFFKLVPLKLPALRDVPFVLFVACAFLFGEATLKYLTCAVFSQSAAQTSALVGVSLYTSNTALVILCFILLPAVLEQMLFSGLVLSEYHEFGDLIAILMSALFFAMAHFSFENFFFYLFYGFALALVTRITGTVLPAVFIAAISFALDVYLEDLFFDYITKTGTSSLLFYFFCGLFLLFSFFAVAHLEKSYARRARSVKEGARAALEEALPRKNREQDTLTFGAKLRLCFFSPLFILLICLFVLLASGIL